MKITIVGAGAIGGYLAVRLAAAGAQVSVFARGAHLAAIRENGLILEETNGETEVFQPFLASDDFGAFGPQDVVIVAVKAQGLAAIAEPMRALYGPDTAIVYAQNGIPWWYFQRHGGEFDGHQIAAVDPDGLIASSTEIERVIGCVVYSAGSIVRPGVIHHGEGKRFLLGEPDGELSERTARLSELMIKAGLDAPVFPDIRNQIWLKLWGNLSFNSISALTRATLNVLVRYPLTRQLAAEMMAEAEQVAGKLGVRFPVTIEQRLKMTEAVGAHKTSMLQDIEAGRSTEIDVLTGAVAELGRLVNVPTPHINAIYASVKLLEQNL